jgi:ATP-dependent DNA helicase RecQ
MESMKTSPKAPTSEDLQTLKGVFGYDGFRAHQFEAVSALKAGKDVFLRKPTGGGKSLIYQYLALDQKVLVLSPLIALMDDQVAQSKKYGIKSACMHSQQDHKERTRALKSWESGEEVTSHLSWPPQ